MQEIIKQLSKPLPDEEIELRIGSIKERKGFTLLAYKTARTDIHRLNDVCGVYWKNRFFYDEKQLLCCEISIFDQETKQWIPRADVGVESFTEKEKGSYSDARKRAGFCWGIGIELYRFPFIWIHWSQENWYKKGDKLYPKGCYTGEWKIDRSSGKIVIHDKNNNIIWSESGKSQRKPAKSQRDDTNSENETQDTDQNKSSLLFDKSKSDNCGEWIILKGKNAGKKLREIPDGTMKWYVENMEGEWQETANLELHRRSDKTIPNDGEQDADSDVDYGDKIRKIWDFLGWSSNEIRDDVRDQGFDSPMQLKSADAKQIIKYWTHLRCRHTIMEIKRGWDYLEWDTVHQERSIKKHLELSLKEFESCEDLKLLEKYYQHLLDE